MNYAMKMKTPRGEMAMNLKTVTLYPDKSFTEISVMGMKLKRVIKGEKGYMNQMGQKRNIPEDQIMEGRFSRMYDIIHKTDQYSFQYLKEAEVNQQKYQVIYLTSKEQKGRWAKLYINKKTLLVDINESMSGQGLVKNVSSNYKKVKGIPFAHKTLVYTDGKKSRDITVKSVVVNPRVDKSLFKLE